MQSRATASAQAAQSGPLALGSGWRWPSVAASCRRSGCPGARPQQLPRAAQAEQAPPAAQAAAPAPPLPLAPADGPQQQPHRTAAQPAAADSAPAASRCPVLAALPPPPRTSVPLWRRIEQFTNPPAFQAALLKDHDIVYTPEQMGFPELVVPGTADMVRAALAREGDITGPARFFSLGDLIDFEATAFMNEGRGHKRFREVMRPAFDASVVAGSFLPDIAAIVAGALEGAAVAGGPVSGYGAMKRLTFEVIMNVMMGKAYPPAEVDRLHHLFNEFTAGMASFPQMDLPFLPYGKAMSARRQLLNIFDRDLAAARAAAAEGRPVAGQLGIMISALDEDGNTLMDDRAVKEILLGLLFAGHDTTSTSLTRLIATLHDHPEVTEKLRREQEVLVEKHGRGVSPGLMRDMVYADAVIRESMRLNPVTNELFRSAIRDFEMGGVRVPAGASISLPMATVTASDPRWAGKTGEMDPNVFNPERMLTPEGLKPGDQMPFGHGGRHCLGVHLAMAEMKSFLALMGQGYRIEADTNTEWQYGVGRVPKNGLPMVVTRL